MCKASASAPANGPRPTASTVIVAQTSSGTERSRLSSAFQGARQRGKASSSPAMAASRLPMMEMARVSHNPWATLRSQAALRSGEKKPATKLPIDCSASRLNSADQSMPSSQKLAHRPMPPSSSMAALRQPKGIARAAGGVSSARRSHQDSRSASATSSMKASKMLATSPPLSIFIAWSISWPRPPAPTKPITTEARIAHSQR